jgi:hypothetical protein
MSGAFSRRGGLDRLASDENIDNDVNSRTKIRVVSTPVPLG